MQIGPAIRLGGAASDDAPSRPHLPSCGCSAPNRSKQPARGRSRNGASYKGICMRAGSRLRHGLPNWGGDAIQGFEDRQGSHEFLRPRAAGARSRGHPRAGSASTSSASSASDVVKIPMTSSPSRTGRAPISARGAPRRLRHGRLGGDGHRILRHDAADRVGEPRRPRGVFEEPPQVAVRNDAGDPVAIDDDQVADLGGAHLADRALYGALLRHRDRAPGHPVPHRGSFVGIH